MQIQYEMTQSINFCRSTSCLSLISAKIASLLLFSSSYEILYLIPVHHPNSQCQHKFPTRENNNNSNFLFPFWLGF
jgi:hypothetical protein